MNIELPNSTAKKLEQLRRTLGTTRVDALDRVINTYLEDKQLLDLLRAPNLATENMTEDEIYEITTAAVQRARSETRSEKSGQRN